MAVRSRQIGWSNKCNILYNILREFDTLKGQFSTYVPPTFTLGQEYGGGIISYIDGSGQHGIIRAPNDGSCQYSLPFSPIYKNYGTSENYGEGRNNTDKIYNDDPSLTNTAAWYCKNFAGGGYTDWFLPSKDEIIAMVNAGQWVSTYGGGSPAYDVPAWSSSESVTNPVQLAQCKLPPNASLDFLDFTKEDNLDIGTIPCRYF